MNYELGIKKENTRKKEKKNFSGVIRNSLFVLRVKPSSAGFTLVELMVSISIFVVVTTLAVYNNSKFNNSILLTNLSYEIGLSIRQAQFYGISVKANTTNTFTSAYGVHFDSTTPKSYILFEDTNINGIYDDGAGSILQTYTIRKGNGLGKMCLNGSSSSCVTSLDISFKRPDTKAIIRSSGLFSKAEVCVISPAGDKRKITVDQTGQISVSSVDTSICN